MIDIQKLAKLVGLKVSKNQEENLYKKFTNILQILDKLGEVDSSEVLLQKNTVMQLGQIGADEQSMDHNIFFANLKHPIRKAQMVVKHKGRVE